MLSKIHSYRLLFRRVCPLGYINDFDACRQTLVFSRETVTVYSIFPAKSCKVESVMKSHTFFTAKLQKNFGPQNHKTVAQISEGNAVTRNRLYLKNTERLSIGQKLPASVFQTHKHFNSLKTFIRLLRR